MSVSCGQFDSPNFVRDLRILGIIASPPEVVSDFDPDMPQNTEVEEVEICALVADPADSRSLQYSFGICPPQRNGRCDDVDQPYLELATGTIEDPEESSAPTRMCATIKQSLALQNIIEASVALDSLAGFGGVAIQVELYVHPEGSDESTAIYGTKRVLYSPRFPKERVANRNPSFAGVSVIRESGIEQVLLEGRCKELRSDPMILTMGPRERVQLTPLEADGVREDYVLPTFDGEVRYFTENLSYYWLATSGGWSRGQSGGPRNAVGAEPPLDTIWQAPSAEIIGEGASVDLWIIQRDERGGQAWYQSCVKLEP